jgi:outer membrane protein OmpA-like peptidoglycan-associated protein
MPLGADYAFQATADGYLFYSEHYALKKAAPKGPIVVEILLEKLKLGHQLVMKNIFFETNKHDLLPTSITELNTLVAFLTDNPKIGIQIQGYTDNVGATDDNLRLSVQRAKAVYDYLIANKVAAHRLSYKGFGESDAIADNSTEEGRKQNRRTSFVVTGI